MRAKGKLLILFLIFPSHLLIAGIVKQSLRSGYDLYRSELSLTFLAAKLKLRRGIRFISGYSRVIGQLLQDKQAIKRPRLTYVSPYLVTGCP